MRVTALATVKPVPLLPSLGGGEGTEISHLRPRGLSFLEVTTLTQTLVAYKVDEGEGTEGSRCFKFMEKADKEGEIGFSGKVGKSDHPHYPLVSARCLTSPRDPLHKGPSANHVQHLPGTFRQIRRNATNMTRSAQNDRKD